MDLPSGLESTKGMYFVFARPSECRELTAIYRIYYQYDAQRLQTCPVNVHYLLHVADSIQYIGPVWCYWAFPMERYCSFIGASVKSRRFPYTNLARRIRDVAQLRVIRDLYGLHGSLGFNKSSPIEGEEDVGSADILPDCKYKSAIVRMSN